MRNAIFLTHKNTLGLENSITGGVQLCSQEFYNLLSIAKFNLKPYYVNYTKNIIHRLLIKLKFDCYNIFDIKKDQKKLISYIKTNNINYIFINLASLIKYSKPIKEIFKDNIQVYLLSHGNDSGDFLHLLTKPIKKPNLLRRKTDLFRIGNLIYIESLYRNKFLDGVLTVSKVEEQIENWLGSKIVIFIPRAIKKDINLILQTNYSKAGFIGRLDHPPNRQGLELLFNAFINQKINYDLKISIIGSPQSIGQYFQNKYPFISYIGELLDNQLEQEISTWALFLNPVFWYSMGVTTKVAKAIEWGIPVITTKFGLRGYEWTKGQMSIVNNENDMAKFIISHLNNSELIEKLKQEMIEIKNSSYSINELVSKIETQIK